jgi:hypothetical protein
MSVVIQGQGAKRESRNIIPKLLQTIPSIILLICPSLYRPSSSPLEYL